MLQGSQSFTAFVSRQKKDLERASCPSSKTTGQTLVKTNTILTLYTISSPTASRIITTAVYWFQKMPRPLPLPKQPLTRLTTFASHTSLPAQHARCFSSRTMPSAQSFGSNSSSCLMNTNSSLTAGSLNGSCAKLGGYGGGARRTFSGTAQRRIREENKSRSRGGGVCLNSFPCLASIADVMV